MTKNKTLLWLDDYRNPTEDDWLAFSPIHDYDHVIWVKNYNEATEWVNKNGLPYAMCLDHDLGFNKQLEYRGMGKSKKESRRLSREYEKTGYDFAKFIIDYCIDRNLDLPYYNFQSANPIGKKNMEELFKNFNKYKNV